MKAEIDGLKQLLVNKMSGLVNANYQSNNEIMSYKDENVDDKLESIKTKINVKQTVQNENFKKGRGILELLDNPLQKSIVNDDLQSLDIYQKHIDQQKQKEQYEYE